MLQNKHIIKQKIKQNTKTKTKTIFKSKIKSLKGGKFLGEGSYGCVVSPSLSCNKKQNFWTRASKTSHKKNTKNTKNTKHINNTKKLVSKILISPNEEDKEEIIISNKLKQIDPNQTYFITFEDNCPIKNIPKERSNTVSVEYSDKSLEYFEELDKTKKIDKQFCAIDLRLKPINIIMPYGGYNLLDIIDNKNKDNHFKLTSKFLIANFKSCFKNLLIGIIKMHNIRIVNRDIKCENIMANYNNNTKQVELRFIDFGLSNILTNDYCKTTQNIDLHGTEGFISPDLVIAFYINDNRSFDTILKILNEDIKDNLESFKEYKITTNFNAKIKELYNRIKTEFVSRSILNKKLILNTYYGSETNKYDGYLQKGDIFALGISMYEFLYNYKKNYKKNNINNINNANSIKSLNNTNLYNLLQNMVQINPDNRYNVIQCLKHSYFTSK